MSEKTIFQKIIDKEIPATIYHEDEHCIAFADVNPQAPVHVLLVSKKVIPKLTDLKNDDLSTMGHLMLQVPEIARKLNISDNFRLVINNGALAGQTVYHLHLHILGGRPMSWPPG